MARPRPRLWLKVHVVHSQVAVYLAHEDHPKLEGNAGMWHADQGKIYLRDNLSDADTAELVMHELLHVIDERVSLGHTLATASKTPLETWQYTEAGEGHMELLIRQLSPALVGMLLGGKFLRLPKVPRAPRK